MPHMSRTYMHMRRDLDMQVAGGYGISDRLASCTYMHLWMIQPERPSADTPKLKVRFCLTPTRRASTYLVESLFIFFFYLLSLLSPFPPIRLRSRYARGSG